MSIKRILAVYLLCLSRACLGHPLFFGRQNPIPLEELPPLPRISDVLRLSETDESILQNFQFPKPGVESIPIDLDSLSSQISAVEEKLIERRKLSSHDLLHSPYSFGNLPANFEPPLDTPIDTEFVGPPTGFPKPIPDDVELIIPPPPPPSLPLPIPYPPHHFDYRHWKTRSPVKRDASAATTQDVSTTLRAISGSQLESEIISQNVDPTEKEIQVEDVTKHPDSGSSVGVETAAVPTTEKTDSSSSGVLQSNDGVESAEALDSGVHHTNPANSTFDELLSIILKNIDLKDEQMKVKDATKNFTLSAESTKPSTTTVVKADNSSDESVKALGAPEYTPNPNVDIARPTDTALNGSSPIVETESANVIATLDKGKLILVEPASIIYEETKTTDTTPQQSKPTINGTAGENENETKWGPMTTGIFIPYAQSSSFPWNSLNAQDLTQLLGGVAQNFNSLENQMAYQIPPSSYYYYPQLENLNFRYIPRF